MAVLPELPVPQADINNIIIAGIIIVIINYVINTFLFFIYFIPDTPCFSVIPVLIYMIYQKYQHILHLTYHKDLQGINHPLFPLHSLPGSWILLV